MEDELQGQMIVPPQEKIGNFEEDLKIIEDIKTKLKNPQQKKPKVPLQFIFNRKPPNTTISIQQLRRTSKICVSLSGRKKNFID